MSGYFLEEICGTWEGYATQASPGAPIRYWDSSRLNTLVIKSDYTGYQYKEKFFGTKREDFVLEWVSELDSYVAFWDVRGEMTPIFAIIPNGYSELDTMTSPTVPLIGGMITKYRRKD